MRVLLVSALALACGCGDGDDGLNTLVNVATEPAGANCEFGGVLIETGVDDSGDEILDTEEIASTEYVCAGAGDTGDPASLNRLDSEPAGANCAGGGVAVHQGADDNGDGVLDDDEIDQTSYVCEGSNGSLGGGGSTILDGDVVIADALDAELFARFTEVTGNLTIEDLGLSSLDLPNLATVGGDISIVDNQLASLDLTVLASAGGLSIDAPLLTSFSFPSLTIVDDTGGNGHLNFQLGDDATTVSLPLLTESTRFVVNGAGLTSLSIPELATVGDRFEVRQSDTITTLSAPKLVTAGDFIVRQHVALTTLDFPLLTTVDDFTVRQNTALCNDDVVAFEASLTVNGTTTINSNGGACI